MSKNFNDVMAYWGGKEKTLPPPKPNRAGLKKPSQPEQKIEEFNNNNTQSAVVIVIPIPNNNVNIVSPDTEKAGEGFDTLSVVSDSQTSTSSGYNNFTPTNNSYDNRVVGEDNNNNNNSDTNSYGYNNKSDNKTNSTSTPLMDSVKTSYNSSNYGGSTVGGSLYGSSMYGVSDDRRKAYLLDEEDEYYGEGEEDDDIKKSYIETDISEDDLQRLENMLISNSIVKNESTEMELESKIEELKKNSNKYVDLNKAQHPSANPYISNTTFPLFITSNSSYKDTSFLTDSNGLSTSTLPSKQISQSKDFSNVEALTSWNSEFQKLIEMDDCLEKFERLSSLEHDFVYASETYGRIIISEHFLPLELRTIKPVVVGGIAGGEKYIVQGILFKFAVENETFGLYGNDENAMKTAAHELNGCTSFLNVGVKGLHVPLMAYIDYRGFRLVAMSLLPISKKSLIYGSSDAGQTVHTSNTLFNHLFTTSAKIVNLKSHVVQDMSGDFKTIHGPIDIEGHIGSDNRFYLLDFARLSPPEPPTHRGSYLYKLLRLEFVRTYSKPLCSDAFSPMVNIDIENHNNDVKEAYEYLLNTIVPKMAVTIDEKLETADFRRIDSFSKLLHSEGINVRLIGQLYKTCKTSRTMVYLLVEALYRTLKSLARELLRREMKKTHLPSDYPYRLKIINFLNLIFGQYQDETQTFWENILVPKMLKKYKGIEPKETPTEPIYYHSAYQVPLEGINISTPLDIIKTLVLQSPILRYALFTHFIDSIGLIVTSVAKDDFRYHQSDYGFIFVDPDIIELSTKITRLNIIDYADGMSLYYKSLLLKENSKSKSRLLSISKSRLEQSLSSMSTNYAAIYQLGNVIRLMAKFNSSDSTQLLELAETTYLSLEKLRIEPNLLFQSKICRSKSLYQRVKTYSSENCFPKLEQIEKEVLENYSNFKGSHVPTYIISKAMAFNCSLRNASNYTEVIERFEGLIKRDPKDYKSHVALAIFYMNVGVYLTVSHTPVEIIEKTSSHLQIALFNNPALIQKLDSVTQKNCWKIFTYANEIPILKVKAREFLMKFDKVLQVPNGIKLIEGDIFDGFKFETLKMVNNNDSDSVATILKALSNKTLTRINLSGFENDSSIIPSILLPLSNQLVKLNLGKCGFVNDNIISTLITPSLKNIKIYNNSILSDACLITISDHCHDLEVLDMGSCGLISPDAINYMISRCPNIRKLALPPSTLGTNVSNAFSELKSLASLDLMGCKDVARETINNSFTLSTSLIKLRDVNGVPHFQLPAGTIISLKTNHHFGVQEKAYYANYNQEKLLLVTLTHKPIPFLTKVFSFFYHHKHPLVKFRDSPLDRKSLEYIKVFHVERVEKPQTKLDFFIVGLRNPQHTIRYPPNLQIHNMNFVLDGEKYTINYRIINNMSGSYSAIYSSLENQKLAVYSNAKYTKSSHELEIFTKPMSAQVLLSGFSTCIED